MTDIQFRRGDVVDVDLSGALGQEMQVCQVAGTRPCVVVQNDMGNHHSPLTVVVPLTGGMPNKIFPMHVLVEAKDMFFPDGAGRKDSVIKCEQIRAIDRASRIVKHRGWVTPSVMEQVDRALMVSLGLTR